MSRSGWLGAVGLLVSVLRTVLFLPAQVFAFVMLQLAAASWLAQSGEIPGPGAAAHGVQIAISSPRFLGLVAGLWLAAAALAAALRVAYLAGALPTLGGELARSPGGHRFAAGFARGFVALLPTAVVALIAEAGALGAAIAFVAAAAVAAGRLFAVGHGALGAAAAAGGASSALLVVACTSALCEAALCRTVLRGERAARAFARAAMRFGARPAAFLAVGIASVAVGAVLGGSADALAALGAGAAAAHPSPWIAAGPQLIAATLAALAAAAVELWRLASTAVLACHAR